MSALHLDTLNKQRAMLLVQSFMAGGHEDMRPEWVSTKVMCLLLCVRLTERFLCFMAVTGVEVVPLALSGAVRLCGLRRPAFIAHAHVFTT